MKSHRRFNCCFVSHTAAGKYDRNEYQWKMQHVEYFSNTFYTNKTIGRICLKLRLFFFKLRTSVRSECNLSKVSLLNFTYKGYFR